MKPLRKHMPEQLVVRKTVVLKDLCQGEIRVQKIVIMNTGAGTPLLAAGRSVVPLFSNKSSGMMQYPQFTDRYTFS